MAFLLVNPSLGNADSIVPGSPVSFGLKSKKTLPADAPQALVLYSTEVAFGLTNVLHRSEAGTALLPENDQKLKEVFFEVAEHRTPVAGSMARAAAGGGFSIGPAGAGYLRGIYEVVTEIDTYATIMGAVSFKVRNAWTKKSHYWSNLSVAPIYFGLENGVRNTGIFGALDVAGNLVVGGPLHAYGAARPGQVSYPINWAAYPEGSIVTVLLRLDVEAETFDVWVQGPTDASPVALTPKHQVSTLGNFASPSSGFSQQRSGPSTKAVLYFGNGSDDPADVVEIVDFALYPDVRQALTIGRARDGFTAVVRSDTPVTYFANTGVELSGATLAQWKGFGFPPPETKFWYQPGRPSSPLYASIVKASRFGDAFLYRDEPGLEDRVSGASFEAWMFGRLDTLPGVGLGFGFRIEDGEHSFEVAAIDAEYVATYGILKDVAQRQSVDGYHVARSGDGKLLEADHSGLRLVRLTVDRLRAEVRLFVEDPDVPFLKVPLTETFPAPLYGVGGKVAMGHLGLIESGGEMNVGALDYVTNYKAWEFEDARLPEVSAVPFTLTIVGDGSAALLPPTHPRAPNRLVTSKAYFGPGSTQSVVYSRDEPFDYYRGIQLDFRMRISSYTSRYGVSDAPRQWTGAGINLYFSTSGSPDGQGKMVRMGMFDCGAYGRFFGIIPGNGTINDILDQTDLGRQYSTPIDWMQAQTLRVVYKPFNQVEVWGSTLIKGAPLLTIPWSTFAHEHDPLVSRHPSIAFGCFNPENNCVVEWDYLRWSVGRGGELVVQQTMEGELPDYLFDGRQVVLVEASETSYNHSGAV